MATMRKTPKGTICATSWENGIAIGIYGKDNCASMEYDPKSGQIVLLLNGDNIARENIVIKHVRNEDFQTVEE